ncbi:hypothetical protein TWF730_004474 [Orbilia blumenaviensis]|uniref:SCP domain-containing protein n=1 Tax=Orbilia blumenaviensis TaxID=1796055 RepID=A0AAV9U0P3_9PEZI
MLPRGILVFIFAALGLVSGVFSLENVHDFVQDVNAVQSTGDGPGGPPKVNFDSLGNLQLAIARINAYRKIHQVPDVHWNSSLAQYAANVAYPCKFRGSNGPYGEILAGSTTVTNPEWYIWFLYGEGKDYDFKNPKINDPATKRFSQIIWGGSKWVGCAFVDGCPELRYQLWCEFAPKGNVGSQLAYRNNVKPADRTQTVPGMPPTTTNM